ncbi:unnamed protein product, partial [Linum tenue]
AVLFLHADVGRSPIFAAAHGEYCTGVTVVAPTDTCRSLVERVGITMEELFSLNPNLDCNNLPMIVCTRG